jgi:hypothetical protein
MLRAAAGAAPLAGGMSPGPWPVPLLAAGGYWTAERSALLELQFGKKGPNGQTRKSPPFSPSLPGRCHSFKWQHSRCYFECAGFQVIEISLKPSKRL